MNDTVEGVESVLVLYPKACDFKDTRATGTRRPYVEADCVTWLSKLLKQYRKSQTFSFEAPLPDATEGYRKLAAGHGFHITDMEAVMKAAQAGRLTIRQDDARRSKKRKS